jgi:hypothetical protein
MSDSVVKIELIKVIKELEESGDIVVVNPIENAVADKIFNTVKNVSPNMLSENELRGIVNALNAHKLGFGLGEEDFQSIVGLTKEELNLAVKKLKVPE